MRLDCSMYTVVVFCTFSVDFTVRGKVFRHSSVRTFQLHEETVEKGSKLRSAVPTPITIRIYGNFNEDISFLIKSYYNL